MPRRESGLVPVDPLSRYLVEVSRYPLLSLDEERELVRRYKKTHDREAAHRLVTANLRLVVKIALDYRNAFNSLLDLIGEGNVGLLRALDTYDPLKGTRFSYYASWWIRAYILKYILDNFRLIKIGTTQAQRKLFFNLMQEKNRIEQMGFDPTPRLLSGRLGVKPSEVTEMESRMTQRELSLDAPRGEETGTLSLDFIPSLEAGADEKLAREEFRSSLFTRLRGFAETLGPRDRAIFEERLTHEVPKTLQEIADRYGISKERVRQLEERIKNKLKTFFEKSGFHIE